MKFAIVAPVVSTPPQLVGSRNSSFSQSRATRSAREPIGELTQLNEFWSNVEASQSAPRAAGVAPPVTKWKKRGPAERVAPARPAAASSERAACAPAPEAGRGSGAKVEAASSIPGGAAGSFASRPR